jgi:hypothetical protein
MAAVSRHTFDMAVCQSKQVRLSKLGITRAPLSRDLQEAECRQLIDGRSDPMAMDTVFYEIIKGDGEPAVVFPTVVGQLDLYAIEDFARAKADDAPRRRLQHINEARSELRADA